MRLGSTLAAGAAIILTTLTAHFEKLDVFELWRQLSLRPKTYQDVWREWFLPTALGELASAP